jgi:hypothetical protein
MATPKIFPSHPTFRFLARTLDLFFQPLSKGASLQWLIPQTPDFYPFDALNGKKALDACISLERAEGHF